MAALSHQKLDLCSVVRIDGLVSSPALNGSYGIIVGRLLPGSGRFPVQLQGGDRVVQVKPENIDGSEEGTLGAPAFDLAPNACRIDTGEDEGIVGSLFISDLFTASHIDYLKELGITHVLNCAVEVRRRAWFAWYLGHLLSPQVELYGIVPTGAVEGRIRRRTRDLGSCDSRPV